MKKENIINSIGFGLIVIDLIVIFVNQNNNKVVLFAVAIGLLIYGIMSIFKKNVFGYLSTCVAITLAISGGLFFSHKFNLTQAFTFMISSSVALIMLLTLVFYYYKKKVIDKIFKLTVEAEVVELISNPNTEAKYYQPVYRYEVNDHEYTVPYPGFLNKNIPKIGDKQMIRVDADDNLNVYFDKTPMQKLVDILLMVFLIVMAVVIMVGQFK